MLVKEKESAFTKIKFEPTINKKSQRLASQKFENLIAQAKPDKLIGHNIKENSKRSASNEGPMKYEDFLISKAQLFKDKLLEKAKKLENDKLLGCTFSPRINKIYRSSGSTSNRRSGVTCFSDQANKVTKRPNSHELKKYEVKAKLVPEAPPQLGHKTQRSVFINLYEIAKARNERSRETKMKYDLKKLTQSAIECTFKPDFSKTQRATQKYIKHSSRSRDSRSQLGIASKYSSACNTSRVPPK